LVGINEASITVSRVCRYLLITQLYTQANYCVDRLVGHFKFRKIVQADIR